MLKSLVNNSKTDKNTDHSYLDLYETLLEGKRRTAKNVLEIGIGDFDTKNGGSIKLWLDYFTNATIYACDLLSINRVMDEVRNNPRAVLHTSTDAYLSSFVNTHLASKKFDVLIDDGAHTIGSMKSFIDLYSPLMTDDGVLIIEDVKTMAWIDILVAQTPAALKPYIKVYDLRKIKNRSDDIVFTIDKRINDGVNSMERPS